MPDVVIELLSKDHDRKSFECAKQPLTDFLREKARKHADQNISKTWVAVEQGSTEILGYITLTMASVAFEHVDESITKKLPRHPIPVLHVGRLATSKDHEGRGIGSFLLQFAAEKAIEASDVMGCFALELFAMDQDAYDYYVRRGFLPLKKDTMRLYMLVDVLRKVHTA